MTDHQRADTALAEHPAQTPNLVRFAQEGLIFTNAFCPSPHCCPSRATFFTGLYPSQHGVWNNICNEQALSHGVKKGVRLWCEDLAEAGYALDFIGKWHVSVEKSPVDYGWKEHFVSAAKGTHHGARWGDYQRIASSQSETERQPGQILRPGYGNYTLYGSGDNYPGLQHDETVVNTALKVLGEKKHSSTPWIMFVGLIGPHDPYIVPQKYLDLYDLADIRLPTSYFDLMQDKPRIYQRLRNTRFGQLSELEIRDAIRHFYAYCSYLDAMFGRILVGLEATGQSENTLVVYCSDHGDYCGEHGLFAKGIPCFQGAYRVPLVMRWPNGIENPGRRETAFVSLADVGPTFLDAVGIMPANVMGKSLMPFLEGAKPGEWREEMHTQCNGVELYYSQRSVMTEDYKYVYNGFDDDELYDLYNDPDEMYNKIHDPALEAVRKEYCQRMWRFAYENQDEGLLNNYITVGLAPFGLAGIFS